MRIKDESTPNKVKADPFSTTGCPRSLLALQAGISLPPWGGLLAVGWWGVTCPFHFEVPLSDGSSQAWEKPAVLPHPFNTVLYGNPDLHFPVTRRVYTENKCKISHGSCTQIRGREHSPYLGDAVPAERGCGREPAPRSWAAGRCHGLAAALCECPNWECQVSSIQQSVLKAQSPARARDCPTPLLAKKWTVITVRRYRGLLAVSTVYGKMWEGFKAPCRSYRECIGCFSVFSLFPELLTSSYL